MIDPKSLDFFRRFFRAYPKRSVLMVGLLALAGTAGGLGVMTMVPVLELIEAGNRPPSSIAQFVNRVLAFVGLEPRLINLLGLIVVMITAKAVLLWMAMRQVGFTVARVTRDLRLRLIRALLAARWRYFGQQASGSFANTVSAEALRASYAYQAACTVLADGFQVLVYIVLSVTISWKVTLFAIVAGGILTFVLRGFIQMAREAGQDQSRLTHSLTGRLVDVVQGIKPVKAMAREELVLPFLERETEGLRQAHRRRVIANETRQMIHEPIVTLLLAAVLFMLIEVSDQSLSSVLVLAFLFYRLMQHINTLQNRYQGMVSGEAAFWLLTEQIEEAEEEHEVIEGGAEPPELRRSIRFEGVNFQYEPGKPVLEDLDLEIPKGTFVAITGTSGSGKTTLADILLGLHRPDAGEVWVDDEPLSGLSLRAWRRRLGYVPQELLLFNESIFNNVTLGDDQFTEEDVERALHMAGAWEFVRERPDGVQTEVGDKGGMLSGGQRQRIAIARALVHRPSLLVLDEVTTALDPATERAICETLRGLTGEVTILSISHQPAMREVADVAYLMKAGKLERLPESVRVAEAV